MKHWTIGSRSRRKADLHLDDKTVSALHATLKRTDDGRWLVQDRDSTNGTARFVNGQWVRITQDYVLPDERLRFGHAETTVRQLLARQRDPAHGRTPGAGIPWRQDLTIALSHIRDMEELKKNVSFVLDLISSPAQQMMRCAFRRRPVNPFSFMVFGGIMYTMITSFGLTFSALIKLLYFQEGYAELLHMLAKAIPKFILVLTLTLIFNLIPFRVFRYFTATTRSFDDFMRLMAVVNGMSWMLLSFIALFWNEHLYDLARQQQSGTVDKADEHLEFALMAYILTVIIAVYLTAFNLIAQKHFWKISYTRTIFSYVITTFVFVVIMIIIFSPIILLFIAIYLRG